MNRKRGTAARLLKPPRAVIDIGSNTVRLVIYEGSKRAPETVWNEKVAARLGRDLSETGRIPQEAQDEALAALARYALIIRDLGIEDIQTVATAAPRDAENGPEFLSAVADLGLEPRLLSGEEEARISAHGALGAFPGSHGVVADLGGGSLELVSIGQNACHDAISLPFGTLRLPAVRAAGGFEDRVRTSINDVDWAADHSGPMYMIGGTWRALASYAMRELDYPLDDPHGFVLSVEDADRMAAELVDAKPEKLSNISGISSMRSEYLPDAAALLRPLLEEFEPEELVFSSWGIREGLLYARLDAAQQARDPLLAGVGAFAAARDSHVIDATLVSAWTADLVEKSRPGDERKRIAAAQLAASLRRVEPNLRLKNAVEWSLDKRWIDLSPRGRAMICAALVGSLGRTELPDRLRELASDDDLREGMTWGLGLRLAQRLGAGTRESLSHSSLRRENGALVLRLDPERAALAAGPVETELQRLADWLGLEAKVAAGS
ncbi:Ppx/GppA family phosphatase [Qipengyuania sp. G39]|uniref:Ppx/GppA family phosphatase n=1 Tax=Qipengyuania profundimaris TaxID=3067652 RepID=A0ABT9HRB4_9SPHN|nr:Ppx/GppA family phosphatase [Qipengyuania sp. G39]MDP4575670.1 Ppx/GppA family phosphatase [Qipengyuania sp. G39]